MCLLLSAISLWLYLHVFSLSCPPLLIKHSIDVPSTFSNLYLALHPCILLELSTFTNKTLSMCLLLSAISLWLYLHVFSLNCPPLLIKHSIDVPSTFSNLSLALPPCILLELSTFTNKTLYQCAFYFQQSLSGFTSMYSL